MAAARNGDVATMRRLLATGGVDVNVKDEVGVFPKVMRGLKKFTTANLIRGVYEGGVKTPVVFYSR